MAKSKKKKGMTNLKKRAEMAKKQQEAQDVNAGQEPKKESLEEESPEFKKTKKSNVKSIEDMPEKSTEYDGMDGAPEKKPYGRPLEATPSGANIPEQDVDHSKISANISAPLFLSFSGIS